MVQPTLWGPPAWQVLFMCTYDCPKKSFAKLERLVACMGQLLPCKKCRKHFVAKSTTQSRLNKRTHGPPKDPEEMFYWLYCLKDEINKQLGHTSISYDDLKERISFHESVIDDVHVADALVLFAVAAVILEEGGVFVEMCRLLAELLPLPPDSELVLHLAAMPDSHLVRNTVQAARAARIERGFKELPMSHYRKFAQ